MPDGGNGALAERTYTISQLAEAFGLTARTIRFYEDEGLLTPRRQGQQRVYGHADWVRLTLIMRGKRLGFSIAGIKSFLDLYNADEAHVEQMRYLLKSARDRRATLEQQLRDVQQTLIDLREMEKVALAHLEAKGVLEADLESATA